MSEREQNQKMRCLHAKLHRIGALRNKMIKYAAVIPYEYSDDRKEIGIQLVGDHRDDLISILTNPLKKLLEERTSDQQDPTVQAANADEMAFPYPPKSDLPEWKLRKPIVTTIQHGFHLDNGGTPKGFRSLSNANRALYLANPEAEFVQLTDDPEGVKRFQEKYPNGCVFIDFAVDTSTMFIVFYKSKITYTDQTRLFNGQLTDATFCTPKGPDVAGPCALHFDLKNATERTRALFIANYFDDRESILSKVNAKAADCDICDPIFAERGVPFLDRSSTKKGSLLIKKDYVQCSLYSDMVAEGFSRFETKMDDDPVEPCTVLILEPCPPNQNQTFCIVGVIVKSYEEGGP